VGRVEQPGAGLFPLLVGAFALASSLAFVVQSLARASPGPRVLPAGPERGRVWGIALALAGFCLSLPWLGYGLSAFGLTLTLLKLFGMSRWSLAAVTAAVVALASYALFAVALGVPLPSGRWSS
jgi:hypothetical protein